MKIFEAGPIKRTIVIGLKRGDDVLESINHAIKQFGITQGAVVGGIGALQSLSYHYVSDFSDVAKNEFVKIEAPFEMGSLQGVIAEGQPHVHIVACDEKGHTLAGHLELGSVVLYVGEIFLVEFDGSGIGRRLDEFGTNLLTNV